jgi:hypothetical protein
LKDNANQHVYVLIVSLWGGSIRGSINIIVETLLSTAGRTGFPVLFTFLLPILSHSPSTSLNELARREKKSN